MSPLKRDQRPGAPERLPVLIVGCGRMGSAVLAGLTTGVAAYDITVVDPSSPDVGRVRLVTDLDSLEGVTPDLIVLAVKSDQLASIGESLRRRLADAPVIISIMAGVSLAQLGAVLGEEAGLVRAMPNLAAAARQSVSGAIASSWVSALQRERADALLSALGQVVWLDAEADLDAVTAVSGSGLAYFFQLAEALAVAGAAMGLSDDVAGRLARQTLKGAGAMIAGGGPSVAELRDLVVSPGGTTAAALAELEADQQFSRLIHRATAAAKARAEGMSARYAR